MGLRTVQSQPLMLLPAPHGNVGHQLLLPGPSSLGTELRDRAAGHSLFLTHQEHSGSC